MSRLGTVWAEPVTTIVQNGNPANRVDLTILGDGYAAIDMPAYDYRVQQLVNNFFAQEPFREYQRYFNLHRITVASSESGADHPERYPVQFRDTALDAPYNCAGIQRLICVNMTKVLNVVSRSVTPTQRDILIVLVNDPEYGGSGGALVVASANVAVTELVLHELGHSLGLLADEYGGAPYAPGGYYPEPSSANITTHTQRAILKWQHWVESHTPTPTFFTSPGVPGLYVRRPV
jgi:hypothetical protein